MVEIGHRLEASMQHLIGYLIIGSSLLLTFLAVIGARICWNRRLPKIWIQGIGIRYRSGAEEPWEGLGPTISAIRYTLADEYPLLKASDFWIDIVPHDGIVCGFLAPSGLIDGKPINGTVDQTAYLGLFHRRYIMVVRQLRDLNDKIKPAQSSALMHEVAEHYVPYRLGFGWNPGHNPQWRTLTRRMKEACHG